MSAVPATIGRHIDRAFRGEAKLPDLLEAGQAVERLVTSPGWSAIGDMIEAEVESTESKLDGSVLAHEEYTFLHGRRGGLRAYKQAAEAIIEHALERQRKAEQAANAAGESAAER